MHSAMAYHVSQLCRPRCQMKWWLRARASILAPANHAWKRGCSVIYQPTLIPVVAILQKCLEMAGFYYFCEVIVAFCNRFGWFFFWDFIPNLQRSISLTKKAHCFWQSMNSSLAILFACHLPNSKEENCSVIYYCTYDIMIRYHPNITVCLLYLLHRT